jgi:hypothetical protein
MEVALRRRLEGVAHISISQARQTADVTFAAAPHTFSAVAFREAVGEAEVEVLRFELEACGIVALREGQRWLSAGTDRFLLADVEWADGQSVCVSGRLAGESGEAPMVVEGAQTVP